MIFKVVLLFISLYVSSRKNGIVASLPEEPVFGIQEELKAHKNSPVKTIRLKGGDVVDCIDFYDQPSLRHPLLKDHKIQTLPQSYTARRNKRLKKSRSKRRACPAGTVPVRRDHITTDSEETNTFNHRRNADSRNHQIFVELRADGDDTYHGATGMVSVNNISVNLSARQLSTANIWLEGGPGSMEYIVVGWAVGLKDNNPRFFTYWTIDGGKTGCSNNVCGFVQLDSQIAPGQIISPVSNYGQDTYDLRLKINQDVSTSNWVLSLLYKEEVLIGYFPKRLFPNLQNGAQVIAWGGGAYPGIGMASPPMGSGYLPDGEYYNHAAFFRELSYVNESYMPQLPPLDRLQQHSDNSNCYGIQNGTIPGTCQPCNFLFGGPGGLCG